MCLDNFQKFPPQKSKQFYYINKKIPRENISFTEEWTVVIFLTSLCSLPEELKLPSKLILAGTLSPQYLMYLMFLEMYVSSAYQLLLHFCYWLFNLKSQLFYQGKQSFLSWIYLHMSSNGSLQPANRINRWLSSNQNIAMSMSWDNMILQFTLAQSHYTWLCIGSFFQGKIITEYFHSTLCWANQIQYPPPT